MLLEHLAAPAHTQGSTFSRSSRVETSAEVTFVGSSWAGGLAYCLYSGRNTVNTPLVSQDLSLPTYETEDELYPVQLWNIVMKWDEDTFVTSKIHSRYPKGSSQCLRNTVFPQQLKPERPASLWFPSFLDTHQAAHPERTGNLVFRFSWCFLCDFMFMVIDPLIFSKQFLWIKNLTKQDFSFNFKVFGTAGIEVRSADLY